MVGVELMPVLIDQRRVVSHVLLHDSIVSPRLYVLCRSLHPRSLGAAVLFQGLGLRRWRVARLRAAYASDSIDPRHLLADLPDCGVTTAGRDHFLRSPCLCPAYEALKAPVLAKYGPLPVKNTQAFQCPRPVSSVQWNMASAVSEDDDRHGLYGRSLKMVQMVGPVGLEPTTNGLKARCSAN